MEVCRGEKTVPSMNNSLTIYFLSVKVMAEGSKLIGFDELARIR
jgi:hypothetical protein